MVSIVTPTWNCGRFITETIQSALMQTYTNWEMIIVDDCSSDDTREIVNEFAKNDSRIKYYLNEKNCGAAVTRNRALSLSRGRWIAFLDSDDLWLPEKLERQLRFMVEKGYIFTYHEYDEILENGEPAGVHVSGKKRVSTFDMYTCCWPGCLSVMYNAEKIGLVQINDVRKNNDTALWLKIVKKSDCHLLKETLGKYRRRKGSITPPSVLQRIKWHYKLFREAEQKNPILAAVLMCANIFGNLYKKLFYVKRNQR